MLSNVSLKYVLPIFVVGLLLGTQAIAKTSSPAKRSVQVSVHNQTAGTSNQLDENDLVGSAAAYLLDGLRRLATSIEKRPIR